MSGKVYIISHAENEGPGLMGGFFQRLGWEEVGLCLWRGDELPRDLDSAAGIVMLGGPMNVYQEKEYPFLKKEDLFIRGVLREEVPFLGICLGSQLLAKACGAAVTKSPEKEIGWYDKFLLPGIGGLVRPGLGLTQRRQLGNHRGIFAVVLRGHAVEDLRIIMGRLGTDALDFDPVVPQRLS